MFYIRPIYIEDIQNMWVTYHVIVGLLGFYCYHMLWLYFTKYSWGIFLIITYILYEIGYELFYYGITRFRQKYTRAVNLSLRIPYEDIWETRATALTQQYYDYYTYIWRNWHEMEERILLILTLRCIIIGI